MPKPRLETPLEPIKLRIRKGDTVEVISGKDKGKRGEVVTALPRLNSVIVRGANVIVRHTKDRASNRPGASGMNTVLKGGRLEKEAPLNGSKVMVVCPGCHRPTRVGFAYRDGHEKLARRKFRHCKHPDCRKSLDG